jgi:hypothetical protein
MIVELINAFFKSPSPKKRSTMSEKAQIPIKKGGFYRVSNSKMVTSYLRGQIVECVSDSEKSWEYPRFRFNNHQGSTMIEKINPADISAEVSLIDAQMAGHTLRMSEDSFWQAPPVDNGGRPSPVTPIPHKPTMTPVSHKPMQVHEGDWPPIKSPYQQTNNYSPPPISSPKPEENEVAGPDANCPPGIKDLPGKPLTFPWVKYPSDTQHSTELNRSIPRAALVYVKGVNSGYYVLRDTGIDDIKFIKWPAKGVTFVRRFRIVDGKADENNPLDTFQLPAFAKLADIRNWIDENIIPIEDVKNRKIELPFRLTLKRATMPTDVFNKKYKPNGSVKNVSTTVYDQNTGTYVYPDKADTSWDSLMTMVEAAVDTQTFESKTFRKAMRALDVAIKKKRESYKGDYPMVEVYAVWHNYNPESKSFYLKGYEKFPPMMVMFNKFADAQAAASHPM